MRDPYDILGVSKGASAAEIKSAFRKRAKTLHPDANRHDPKAANRFAERPRIHLHAHDIERQQPDGFRRVA